MLEKYDENGRKRYTTCQGSVYMNDEEFEAKRREFFSHYPTYPFPEDKEDFYYEVKPEVFERIKTGNQRAIVLFWENDNEKIKEFLDPKTEKFIDGRSIRRDEYFVNWISLFVTPIRKIHHLHITSNGNEVIASPTGQGWDIPVWYEEIDADERGLVLGKEYGCNDINQYVHDNLTLDAYERKRKAGIPDDEVFKEADDYYWITFELNTPKVSNRA